MTQIGANPEQLLAAASGFESIAEALSGAGRELNSVVSIDWWGADGDQFRSMWQGVFAPELARQVDAIRMFASATRAQADQQGEASGGGATGATAAGAAPGTKRTYRLADAEGKVSTDGKWESKGKATWGADPNAPSPSVETAKRPPGPGEEGYDRRVYDAWFLQEAGISAANRVISGSGSANASASGLWDNTIAGSIGNSDLGASGKLGMESGFEGSASASYEFHGTQAQAHTDAVGRVGVRVFGEGEGHFWKLAAASLRAEGSAEATGSGHADLFADMDRGFGFDTGGSAFGGAHAGVAADLQAVGLGAHAGLEANAGVGVYGSAKGGWTNEKGLTLGLSAGFGLGVGLGASAEFSFHPGKTVEAAVSAVQNIGSTVQKGVETAVNNVVETASNAVTAATDAVNWAGEQASHAGAAINDGLTAMDPRNWSWPW